MNNVLAFDLLDFIKSFFLEHGKKNKSVWKCGTFIPYVQTLSSARLAQGNDDDRCRIVRAAGILSSHDDTIGHLVWIV